jgi:hypothetical protein
MPDFLKRVNQQEVQPGAHGVNFEFTSIFPRRKDYIITLKFTRGDAHFEKDFGVTITAVQGGSFQYAISWKRVKGFIDHDCNLKQLGADRWIPRLQEMFAVKAQEHVNLLAQEQGG